MPRRAKSRVQVEMSKDGLSWSLFKGGFQTLVKAEQWINDEIINYPGLKMRAIRFSGVYESQTKIVKR